MIAKKSATVKPKTKAVEVPYRPTVGDVVKIVKDSSCHGIEIGRTVTIGKDDGDMGFGEAYKAKGTRYGSGWFRLHECEIITKAADVAKESKLKAAMKSKYPAPRPFATLIVPNYRNPGCKVTKAELIDEVFNILEDANENRKDLAATGTKLDRAIVDLKEAKKRIKELELAAKA